MVQWNKWLIFCGVPDHSLALMEVCALRVWKTMTVCGYLVDKECHRMLTLQKFWQCGGNQFFVGDLRLLSALVLNVNPQVKCWFLFCIFVLHFVSLITSQLRAYRLC